MKTQAKERPILFSGPMVRAILDGRKTQTRRIVTPQPTFDGYWWSHNGYYSNDEKSFREGMPFHGKCKFGQAGDRLRISEEVTVKAISEDWYSVHFAADNLYLERSGDVGLMQKIKAYKTGKLRGVYLPPAYARPARWELTGVRCERLQDISNADIAAEGIEPIGEETTIANGSHVTQCGRLDGRYSTMRQLWSELWAKINGQASWDANPWVWVVEFKKI